MQENEGCKNCENAKKAFILINKIGLLGVSTICNHCETIWGINEKTRLQNSYS